MRYSPSSVGIDMSAAANGRGVDHGSDGDIEQIVIHMQV